MAMRGKTSQSMADIDSRVATELRGLLAGQRPLLRMALLAALAAAVRLILQSWWLAGRFSGALRAWQPGEQLQPRPLAGILLGLALCLLLRPLLQYLRETCSDRASQRARAGLRGGVLDSLA